MAYYYWVGINLDGSISSGKKFSRSVEDLDDYLFFNEIALLETKKIKLSIFKKQILNKLKIEFINNLSTLLKSNLTLHQSLQIISVNIQDEYFKEVILDIERSISEGKSLKRSLSYHSDIFDELTRSVFAAGENSSNLSKSIEKLALHNQVMSEFNKKVRASLMTPFLTFLFFLIVMIGIFVFVIPKFEPIFSSHGHDLPTITKLILKVSNFFTSFYSVYFFGFFFSGFLFVKFIFKKLNLGELKRKIIFAVPVWSKFWLLINQAKFLRMLDMLLSSGIYLAESLRIISHSVKDEIIRGSIFELIENVEAGKSFNFSLQKSSVFSSKELIAIASIGESSGEISKMISKASDIYQDRVYTIIGKLSNMVQPTLLILLGLFVACLIFAIYIPIFTLSSIIK